MKRNVVVFGKGGSYSDETTFAADGCRYPEFHWRQLRPIERATVPQKLMRVADFLPDISDKVIRARFEVDGDRKARVSFVPNDYTLAKAKLVVWEGFCMDINEAYSEIMKQALL